MGYSDSFEFECQSNMDHSLHVVLQRSNCASILHLENVIENGRFRVVSSQRNRLQWVDERNEIISISFPAVLDLYGDYSCIPPNFVGFSCCSIYVY